MYFYILLQVNMMVCILLTSNPVDYSRSPFYFEISVNDSPLTIHIGSKMLKVLKGLGSYNIFLPTAAREAKRTSPGTMPKKAFPAFD